MWVHENTVHLLAGQKRLEDDYLDPDVLFKVSSAYMAETMKAIKEFLRSLHHLIGDLLAYITKKFLKVHTYDDYPKYVTSDNEMIARILHLPPVKNKANSVKKCMADTRWTSRQSMICWIRSSWIQICIHWSKSISSKGMTEGHFMPSTSGD